MQIIIPQGPSYDVPEGKYPAILREIERHPKDNPKDQLRFRWEVLHPSIDYRAAKNYSLNNSNELKVDLDSWMGDELESKISANQGKLETEWLIGKRGDLEIVHIHNGSHKKPFVYISAVYPPGTFGRHLSK